MKRSETLLFGMALGAGLTYFLDPDRGSRRRALVRDQLVHAGHEAEEATRAGARHVRNRARGLVHETRARLTERDVDDRVLEERVRSELGRKVTIGSIQVSADQGEVTLTGAVAGDEMQDVVRTVRSVRGVEAVDSRLEVEARSGLDVRGAARA